MFVKQINWKIPTILLVTTVMVTGVALTKKYQD